MKLRAVLAAATVLSLPALVPHLAQAQPVTGPYVSLGAGTALETSSPSDYKLFSGIRETVRSNAQVSNQLVETFSYKN